MTGDAQASRWLDAAVDDLRHARYAEEGGFYAHACFSAQQAAEKAVKAVHYARGARAVLGHSVRNLIERLDPRVPSLDTWQAPSRQPGTSRLPTTYGTSSESLTIPQTCVSVASCSHRDSGRRTRRGFPVMSPLRIA